jgi:hypothetical protein
MYKTKVQKKISKKMQILQHRILKRITFASEIERISKGADRN